MSLSPRKTNIRIAIFGYGMKYSRYGSGTYLRNVKKELERLGCKVDTLDKNRYTTQKASPIFSVLAAIGMVFTHWCKYDCILANEGSGAFVFSPRKIAVIHHSAKEKAIRTGMSFSNLIAWLLQLLNIKTASAIISISNSTWKSIASYVGKTPSKVIWNGVNHDIFKQLPGDQKDELGLSNKLTLFYATRTSPHKNLKALVKLVNLIDLPLNLIFLGSVLPSDLYQTISKMPKVSLYNPGYVDIDKLVRYINAADFHVNISKLEGFGLVQVESMACGTPVIAFNTDENQLIIADGGIVVDSISQMASQIKNLWDNKSQYLELKEKALSRARKFSWRQTARNLLEFCESLFLSNV